MYLPLLFCQKRGYPCHCYTFFKSPKSAQIWPPRSDLIHMLRQLPEAYYRANPLNSVTTWSLLPGKSTQFSYCLKPPTAKIHSIQPLPEAYYQANQINSVSAWSPLPGKSTYFRPPKHIKFQKLVLTIWIRFSYSRGWVYIPLFNDDHPSCKHHQFAKSRWYLPLTDHLGAKNEDSSGSQNTVNHTKSIKFHMNPYIRKVSAPALLSKTRISVSLLHFF